MPLLFDNGEWRVALIGSTPKNTIEATAFKAIRRRLEAFTHVELPVGGDAPVRLQMLTATEEDANLSPVGYRIVIEADRIRLIGGSPKGTLNAAYDFLERLGLRWLTCDDSEGAFGPRPTRIEIEETEVVIEPSFPHLTFFQDLRTLRNYGTDPALAEAQRQNDRDLINWMGRRRFTGLFGNMPESPEPWAEAVRRGIARQYGGHILPRLLPRDLFEEHPEYFPMNEEGERFAGNLCASNPEAIRIVCEHARAKVKETSAEVLHLWGEDVLSGKWCACPECRDMSIHDQYLKVANAVAESLSAEFPKLKVAYIAYHDTLSPKLTGVPHPNLVLLFAPRNRCYRHALADPDCARNAEIYAGLLEYRRIFGEGRLHTFEYYGDALLWCGAAIVLPRMIMEDAKTYLDAGVSDSGCLMFGGYSWFSHPLSLYAFSRASWDASLTADAVIGEYVETLYPGAEDAMRDYYAALEAASRFLAERTDWFYRVPEAPAEAAALIAVSESAVSAWEALTAKLAAAMTTAKPQAGVNLFRERQALRFTQHLARAWDRRIRAAASEEDHEKDAHLGEAADSIRAALRILHDLPPYLRGSWGAKGHGESLRLTNLLERIAPE